MNALRLINSDSEDDESVGSSNYETHDEPDRHSPIDDPVEDPSPSGSDRFSVSDSALETTDSDKFRIHRINLFQEYRNFDKNEYRFHVLDAYNWEDHARSVLHKYEQ